MNYDSTLGALWLHLTKGDRLGRHRRLEEFLWMTVATRLPQVHLTDLFPAAGGRVFGCRLDVDHGFELPLGERVTMAAVVSSLSPAIVFEFGTFTGTTTMLLAKEAPEAAIHTLDLPDAVLAAEHPGVLGKVGAKISQHPDLASRITQHRARSRDLDITPFRGRVDLVYVDAGHDFEDVMNDSLLALEMVSPRGAVVWDDYVFGQPGVVRALHQLRARGHDVRQIAQTRLAILRKVSSS